VSGGYSLTLVGGILNYGTMTMGATILAGNYDAHSEDNCLGPATTDLGYNLTDDGYGSCGLTAPTDVFGANPDLDPLGYYGGPTPTMLPAANSPAIGVIPPGTTLNGVQVCPRTDQRGVASLPGGNCTIGAVEVGLRITTTSLPAGTVGQHYSATLQAAGGNSPYRFWYVAGGSMPKGLRFNSFTGVLSGRPSKARTYTVKFRVRDTKLAPGTPINRAHVTLTITIVPA